jgi:hypothetical protein
MLSKKLMALIVIALCLTSFVIPKASADIRFQPEKFPFKEMQIQVMPEFDYPEDWPKNTPSLLVGEYGTITNKSGRDFSGKIEIPIPSKEKGFETNLVAEFPDPNKPEVQRPYTVDKEKGIVSWTPAKPIKNNKSYKFVIEYYTNTIAVKDKKSFTYELTNNTPIDQLNVIFYAPMNAKNIQIAPKAQNTTKSEYGEALYYYQYSKVKIGNSLKYSFSYKKDGTESTMAAINKQQPPNDDTHKNVQNETATDQVSKSGNDTSNQPIIGIGAALIIAIAIIITGVLIFFGLQGKRQSVTKSTKFNKPQNVKQQVKKESKSVNADEKKELRKKLLTGKIDQETYEEEMKKLI